VANKGIWRTLSRVLETYNDGLERIKARRVLNASTRFSSSVVDNVEAAGAFGKITSRGAGGEFLLSMDFSIEKLLPHRLRASGINFAYLVSDAAVHQVPVIGQLPHD
jgi:hypothetical protein